jgi:hypothetical protein
MGSLSFKENEMNNEIKAFANMVFANEITPHEIVRTISKKKCEVRQMGAKFHFEPEDFSSSYWSYYQNEDNQIFTIRLNYKNNWIRVGGFSNTHFFMNDEPIKQLAPSFNDSHLIQRANESLK